MTSFNQLPNDHICRVKPHFAVRLAADLHQLRPSAHLLRLLNQIVRIHADAMPANQTGPKPQRIPLGIHGPQNLRCTNIHAVQCDS
ncbi:hypothetical protein SDC9_188611 [bioreactor metagenome]|uniref:Uncharacterized protein n=1 Tax=bioreactor metagenome TaxID=1076179 RepID=A0A645HPU0_9ZZZZ